MLVLDAIKINDRFVVLTFDREVDFRQSKVSIEGTTYSFNPVYDVERCISIPIGDYDPSVLIGKNAEYVA